MSLIEWTIEFFTVFSFRLFFLIFLIIHFFDRRLKIVLCSSIIMSIYCGVCGTEVDHTEDFCTACGAELEVPVKGSTTNQPTGQPYTARKPAKRLYRCCCDTVAGGVCAGMAEYTDMDPNIVRLVVVILTLFTSGSIAIVYIFSVK